MAMMRYQPFTTTLTAAGTVGGLLTMTATTGIGRHCCLSLTHATGGWRVEVVRIISATQVLARMTGFVAGQGNVNDLSAIPNGATVSLEEQWVPDTYQDDVPATLAIPTK